MGRQSDRNDEPGVLVGTNDLVTLTATVRNVATTGAALLTSATLTAQTDPNFVPGVWWQATAGPIGPGGTGVITAQVDPELFYSNGSTPTWPLYPIDRFEVTVIVPSDYPTAAHWSSPI